MIEVRANPPRDNSIYLTTRAVLERKNRSRKGIVVAAQNFKSLGENGPEAGERDCLLWNFRLVLAIWEKPSLLSVWTPPAARCNLNHRVLISSGHSRSVGVQQQLEMLCSIGVEECGAIDRSRGIMLYYIVHDDNVMWRAWWGAIGMDICWRPCECPCIL